MAIIEFNSIWFVDSKFGVSLRLQQVMVEPSAKLPAFAFNTCRLSSSRPARPHPRRLLGVFTSSTLLRELQDTVAPRGGWYRKLVMLSSIRSSGDPHRRTWAGW